MAKEKKSTTTRRKSTTNNSPSKAKRTTRKKNSFKMDMIIFSSVVVMIGMVMLGYMLASSDMASGHSKDHQVLDEHLQKLERQRIAQLEEEKRKETALRKAQEEAKKEAELEAKRAEEKRQAQLEFERLQKQREMLSAQKQETQTAEPVRYPENITVKTKESIPLPKGVKPKLAIIIDDVSSASQMKLIQSLGLKITPSIFPPFNNAPSSHKLAVGVEHYMIHLPMESGKAFDKQEKTLKITDKPAVIEARVKEIRSLFPTARYINNHTGSVFTDNYAAMDRLFAALKPEGFIFVDSRTIGTTKVPQIAKKYGQVYLSRDVFIDNKQDVSYIHQQLRQAVRLAKKRGYAIAIGHPRKTTMQALYTAKGILNEVDVVYIDELESIGALR